MKVGPNDLFTPPLPTGGGWNTFMHMKNTDSNPPLVSAHGGHSGSFCNHAEDALEEIIRTYIDWGFRWVGITEHMAPVNDRFVYPDERLAGLDAAALQKRFASYFENCYLLKEKYRDQIEILVGFEAETYTGTEAFIKRVVAAFSDDCGESWSLLEELLHDGQPIRGRPLSLTVLGEGRLMFAVQHEHAEDTGRYFSCDYGRTWPERIELPRIANGTPIFTEGSYLVDRDEAGGAQRIAGFGIMAPRPPDSRGPFLGGLHWSEDGGRTWSEPLLPPQWQREESYDGKTHLRGAGEGALVRAANGWIVAALRTDMHPRYFPSIEDNYSGTGVSISEDDGATWSPVRIIHEAGRHHAHLLRLPDGTLVLTYVQRLDLDEGRLVTYRRGCGVLLSRDHGLTWDLDHELLINSFDHADGTPVGYSVGHSYSTLLDDGAILSCYGCLRTKGMGLVKWRVSP